MSINCRANLEDGTEQSFDTTVFLQPGTKVAFIKRERRFFGTHYSFAHF